MRAAERINTENTSGRKCVSVCGKNGVRVWYDGEWQREGRVVCYTHVIGLCWGWWNLPSYEVTRECPSPTKTPADHQKSNWVMYRSTRRTKWRLKCSLKLESSYDVEKHVNGRITRPSAQALVLSLNFSFFIFLSFSLLLDFIS
jgi:hypothetical protein